MHSRKNRNGLPRNYKHIPGIRAIFMAGPGMDFLIKFDLPVEGNFLDNRALTG
jgi:hypothetical protein